MSGLVRFLLSGLAVLLTGYLLQSGVHVEHYGYALLVALVLSIANVIVKPILIIFTIPITIVTLELISTTVLTVASGTLRIESPRGQVVAPMRSMM